MLQGLKCDIAQGYYFGRPIAAEQFTELLQAQSREARPDAVIDIAERAEIQAKNPLRREK